MRSIFSKIKHLLPNNSWFICLLLGCFSSTLLGQSTAVDSIDYWLENNQAKPIMERKNNLAKSLAISRANKRFYKEADILYQFAELNKDLGNYTQTLTYLDTFDQVIQQHQFDDLKGGGYLLRGVALSYLEQFEKAKNYYNLGLTAFTQENDSIGIAKIYINLGALASMQEDLDLTLDYQLKALPILKAKKSWDEYHIAQNNVGYIHLKRNEPNKALTVFQENGLYYQEQQMLVNLVGNYINIGYTYRLLKDYPKAMENYKIAINIAKEEGFNEVLASSYRNLAYIYETTGDVKNAFANYKLFHDVRVAVVGEKVQAQASELQVKYETEIKQRKIAAQAAEIQLLQQQTTIRQQRLWVLALLCLGLLIMGLLWRNKTKSEAEKKQLLQKIQQQKLQHELDLKEQEKKQLTEKVALQSKDLTSLTLDIVRKNDFSEMLQQELASLEKDLPKSTQSKIKDLQFIIQSHLQTNEQLALLQMSIAEINQSFYEKLDTIAKLSQSEKQICGLLRLNLSNKEISIIRRTTTSSTKVFRHRIRKKLGLQPEEDIVAFLKQI